ncbi:response regulator [uncultured Vibrio sp.]|uniref:response regulator n=1 Tax=uncultured Vibrio sp. TaxID=114054 RepID=UPI0025CC93E1|nr:response regulator [uncultured Vibrio sp.]
MSLIQKLNIIVVGLTLCVMLGMGFTAFSISQSAIEKNTYQQLNGTLELVTHIIEKQNKSLASMVEITARNRTIQNALEIGMNKGVSQALNDTARSYENINYLLVIDYDGNLFSSSTTDSANNEFDSKTVLLEHIEQSNVFNHLLTDRSTISSPAPDPYLHALTELQGSENSLSQWVSSPIHQNNVISGWVIISTDWSRSYQALLSHSLEGLKRAYYPILSVSLANDTLGDYSVTVEESVESQHLLEAEKLLMLDDIPYSLRVTFNRDAALKDMSAIQQGIGIVLVAGVLILALVMYVSLRYLVTTPLAQLIGHVKQLTHQGLAYRIPNSQNSELNLIAQSINELAQKLDRTMTSVSRLDEEIDEKERIMKLEMEANTRLTSILDTAADAIITIDLQGKIQSFNQSAKVMFGYQSHEIRNAPVNMLMDTDHAQQHQQYMSHYMKTGDSKIIDYKNKKGVSGRELIAKKKTGELFPITLSVARVETEKGTIFSGIIKDITELKKAEVDAIKAKNEALQAAKLKSEFLAVMSHEIRTPMNGVIGMLDLLLENHLNETQQHQAYLAHSSAVSLLHLINDILDFSKIEADKLELDKHHFDLRRLLGDFCESMAANSNNPDLEIILNTIEVNESLVMGDSTRIRQVFANLLGNAIKFTEKGEIIVEARLVEDSDDNWRLYGSISDTGIGIPTDQIDTLFDKFSQVDASTTRKFGGTGLGLAIVNKLCALMDGTVSVRSEIGKGSRFDFNLVVGKSSRSAQVIPQADISQLSILVVDDNAVNREVLGRQLQHWGASVVEAEGYDHAIECCYAAMHTEQKMFDIAFLDMQMPGTDGLQLCKSLKAHADYQSIKLIMMTSMDSVSNQNEYKELGFTGYFTKPATTSDLFNALNVIATEDFDRDEALVTHNYLSSLDNVQEESPDLEETLHVLIVEDNRVNQIVIKGILHQFGLRSTIAEHGKEAIDILKEDSEIDLILMDCQMPEMDGYEATKRIRQGDATDNYKDIAILAMTANAMVSDKQECLDAGMNDFLTKPINKALVKQKIHEWTRDRIREKEYQ